MIVEPCCIKNPRFIVLEGVNGAGKTTLQSHLAGYLKARKEQVVCTREPGGTEIGKEIRSLVLGSGKGKVVDRAEMFLFAADRAQHVEEVIKPAINTGKIVISDRYFYSTLAFQGYGRGINTELIWEINRIAVDEILPDVVFLLDLDPKTGLERNRKGGSFKDGPDAFEDEEVSFHRRIREGFLDIAKSRRESFIVIDANGSADTVWETVRNACDVIYGQ